MKKGPKMKDSTRDEDKELKKWNKRKQRGMEKRERLTEEWNGSSRQVGEVAMTLNGSEIRGIRNGRKKEETKKRERERERDNNNNNN
jgi:hypothetical protein